MGRLKYPSYLVFTTRYTTCTNGSVKISSIQRVHHSLYNVHVWAVKIIVHIRVSNQGISMVRAWVVSSRGVTIPLFRDTYIVNTKNAHKKVSVITQCCRDLDTIKTAHIYSFMLLFYSPFPWKKDMACYKLGFEEFIIMNKMFVQIFVLLNNFF